MEETPICSEKVSLICMPYASPSHPSIGLSLLKSSIASVGMPTTVHYFSLRFAKTVGIKSYLRISEQSTRFNGSHFAGEWIFTNALFSRLSEEDRFIDDILRNPSPLYHRYLKPVSENLIELILKARDKVEAFLNSCLEEIINANPAIVGFSSLFQQNIPSLALAKRIKAHLPEVFIVFGGANCEGLKGAEMVRQFPFIDAVVSGEGDIVFPQLVQRVINKEPVPCLQGVYTRESPITEKSSDNFSNAESIKNMDDLPYPDYTDYFKQFSYCNLELPHSQAILFETSRGCWWGEKAHCSFCSCNGANIKYRHKSATRALEELNDLLKQHPVKAVIMVDNVLNKDYFKDFIPEFASQHKDVEFFYEVRPDLNKKQIKALRKMGVTSIQPGIESLSTPILRLMRKGVNYLQNIQLLKWCKEQQINVSWNFLLGLPAEPQEEYRNMTALIPHLVHLPPPECAGPIYLAPHSPYFKDAHKFGFTNVSAHPGYAYIYPFHPDILKNLAHYFVYDYLLPQNIETYTGELLNEIQYWKNTHSQSELFFIDDGKRLVFWDQRPLAVEPLMFLSGLKRILYLLCDETKTVFQLQKMLERLRGQKYSIESIQLHLKPLLERRLIVKDASQYLSLAIPVGEYSPDREAYKKFQSYYNQKKVESNEKKFGRIRIEDLK